MIYNHKDKILSNISKSISNGSIQKNALRTYENMIQLDRNMVKSGSTSKIGNPDRIIKRERGNLWSK